MADLNANSGKGFLIVVAASVAAALVVLPLVDFVFNKITGVVKAAA